MAGRKRAWSEGSREDDVSDGELVRIGERYDDDDDQEFHDDVSDEELLRLADQGQRDLSTVTSRFMKVSPQTSSITPIEVYVPNQTEFIDLTRGFVELDLAFKTTGNANLTSRADDVNRMLSPVNNIAHSLFRQINIKLNVTLITEQVDMYHLKAYIQTLLNFDREDGEMDSSQDRDGFKILLNPVALYFNAEANPGAEEVRQHVDDIKLTFFVSSVSINPSVYDNTMSIITKSPAKYPIIRSEMRQFLLDNGATSKEIINPFNGKIPQRIVLGILATTAFNGQYDNDPFAFGQFGVKWVKQIWNGEEYPYETMQLNTGNGYRDMMGYHRFLEATGCLYRIGGNMVRATDWGHGKNCTLFAWSNVPNGRHDDPILLPKEAGFINIQLKCAAQTAQRTIVIYSEYESMLEIDGFKGGVSVDVN
ncbi:Uncharacterized protein F54H12.2 [Stylophora pistillata]|uniref:Uncharacterized protein F54H12.2 n=1 Tax=Stylophora pistillata TaxID=50429 RepID=A0A2B4RE21_STYPI|nr:Uncharacterized protein F54H12.2 [Stylophora pistillata]